MRASIFALTIVAATTVTAYAADAPPQKTYTSASEIQQLVAKAKMDRKGEAPQTNELLLSLAPYRAQVEYRPATATPAPAAVHEKEAEMMYVIDGTGTIVTGGKLVDEKRTNDANLSGTGIDGGNSQAIAKGDFLIVPQNTPHQLLPAAGSTLVMMTFHVPRPVPGQ